MRDKRSPRRGSATLVCVWVTVRGPDGRMHLEARWHVDGDAQTQPAA